MKECTYWGRVGPRVGSGQTFCRQSRVGSGQRFAGSGRVQEKWPVDNSGTHPQAMYIVRLIGLSCRDITRAYSCNKPIMLGSDCDVYDLGTSNDSNTLTRGDVILDLVRSNEPNSVCNLVTQAPLGASDHDCCKVDRRHGFIKSRFTLTNLLSCLRHWLSSLDSGRSTDVTYIDFAKAFDSVFHPKLSHKLKSYNILGKLFDWISAWLTGRTQSVRIHNFFSSFKSVLSGILQGSVLGPLLFLLCINDSCDSISHDVHPTFFADDLKLFTDEIPISSEFLPVYVYSPLLQNSLNYLLSWSELWKLTISVPTCSILSISNSKSPKPRIYSLGTINLPQVKSCLDLGIIIDDKLTFSCHILSSTKKANKQSIIMSRCFLYKNPHLLKSAFTSYVRPILEYASPIWSPHSIKDIDALERVQRRFTKSFSNIRSLSYSARLTRLDLQPLYVRRNHIDLITCFRFIHGLTHLD